MKILHGIRKNIFRSAHQLEKRTCYEKSQEKQEDAAYDRNCHSSMHTAVGLLSLSTSDIVGYHDVRPHGNTDEKVDYQVDNRSVASNSRRSDRPVLCKMTDNSHIDRIE